MRTGPSWRTVVLLPAFGAALLTGSASRAADLAAIEQRYGDWLDASYALSTVEAGPEPTLEGRDAAAWRSRREALAADLRGELAAVRPAGLSAADRAVLTAMRRGLANGPEAPGAEDAAEAGRRCATASDPALDREALTQSLYACFHSLGNHLRFEDRTIARTTALELLQELDSGERRRAVFQAFAPLWAALEPAGVTSTPYRRLLALAAAEARPPRRSRVADAARTLGADVPQVERWLVAVLDRWRLATDPRPVEPWDYWRAHTAASRALDADTVPARILPLTRRFYADLGADLDALQVRHDLDVRPGKAPLAYTDYVSIGREVDGAWRPAQIRVSGNVERGGLFVLNEIVHEDGHAVHMAAVRARPAYFDLGDDLFVEAFADVTSWSVAEPAWQQRYLGRAIDERASLEALYASIMLDVAWGLFELRLLRDPTAAPNAVWTEITSRYLHIIPHPEMPWWALRVQLVHLPGYMINYGLGAVLTADLRAHIAAGVGRFDAGNPRWYGWLAPRLLRPGLAVPTPVLLRRFLGRPVSTAALLAELDRLRPAAVAAGR
ncbi:MAG: hypothetical protein JSR73_02545 [Proteobacteria bacterium]|nr:hypothetical protein [Pseudomonadota bacterium]